MGAVAERRRYGKLLEEYKPAVIKSKEENDGALEAVRKLLSKGEENLDEDELRLVELLSTLISDYERNAYRLPAAKPADVLRDLMRARGMQPKDLWPVFASKGVTSQVLRGKREISKDRAKKLAEIFNVSAELFI